ncbi:FAD-dependent monooxygenase [Nocardia sp. XZ_19_385]|uniref:FAD-dependent monooxygenase n=1 Tax=Nocardia sp. XZ_19_385 TaxID=2769488 RepID=UPI001E5D6808|nr:FAD-dependent monooxygenase [Nocardia sp. XZ_19_385]
MIDVIIAGAGPCGLMLACELGAAGIRTLVLERLPEPSAEPKANGLVGQVVPLMDRRGLHERLSGSAEPPQPNSSYFMFAGLPLNLSVLEQSPVYTLPVPQRRSVEVLEQRAVELGAEIRRGTELVGIRQRADGVSVEVSGPAGTEELVARFLVGADGAHSATRKLAGIDFPGISYDRTTTRTAHVTVPADWVDPASGALVVPGYGSIPPFLPHRNDRGGISYAPFPGHPPLVSTTEWDQPAIEEPMTLEELRASISRVLGVEVPLDPPAGDGPHVLRRLVGGNTRVAGRFRDGRVFLVGDAAHVFATGGGPGLNVGLQDALNLGWKLAAELAGHAPAELLDSYDSERRSAAERTLLSARAQSALIAPGGDVTALRAVLGELMTDEATVRRLADLVAGADISYDLGESEHPLVGRCAPDLELDTADGPARLSELARTARPLLLDLAGDADLADLVSEWKDRVDYVAARPRGAAPATALLLRPDSYVAWAAPNSAARETLRTALNRWFGVPVRLAHLAR